MKTIKTFKNATLRTVNNGYIELDYNGKTQCFHNASVISVNNGSISIEVDWKPERGELVKVLHTGINCYVIFDKMNAVTLYTFGSKDIRGSYYKLGNDSWTLNRKTEFHLVTPEEQQAFDDFCKSQGKIWNKEKLQWEKCRWKPKKRDKYYYIRSKGNVNSAFWHKGSVDIHRYKFGNCFQTKEEAEAKLEEIKQILNSTI